MRDGIDEYTLLCEDCGYVIEGLPREGQCPECGKAVAESLPERRDRVPSVIACLLHPIRCFDKLRISHDKAATRIRRIALAGVAGWVSLTLVAITYFALGGMSNDGLSACVILFGPAIFLLCTIGFEVLSLIESRGLRLIGKTRGFRITHAVSQSITTSASAWWIVAGVGLGLFAGSFADRISVARPSPTFWTTGRVILLSLCALIFCVGFLMFEIMAYLGLRRCKFANRSRPELRQEETESDERRAESPSH